LYFIGQKMSVTLAPGKQQIVIKLHYPAPTGQHRLQADMKWFTEFAT
jgi:hypothetical protein